MTTPVTQPQRLRLFMEPWDRHRWITLLAVAGVSSAGTMAVFGLSPVDLHGPLHPSAS